MRPTVSARTGEVHTVGWVATVPGRRSRSIREPRAYAGAALAAEAVVVDVGVDSSPSMM